MQITYMIGNGFDIALGLKTSYSDFYKYLEINKENFKNTIIEKLLEDNKSNIELWADLEIALGKYTEHIKDDQQKLEQFISDKVKLEAELRKYLENEQNRIDWESTEFNDWPSHFWGNIRNFHHYLYKHSDVQRIYNTLGSFSTIGLTESSYNIISFNYTNTIEKCLEPYVDSAINCTIERFYVHGSLEETPILLGVNDSEQIENTFLKENEEMLISICKPNINKFLGKYKIKRIESILRIDSIVCIFGMSLGASDKLWWNKITSSLNKGIIKLIVIFAYQPKLDKNNVVEVLRAEKKVKKQLLDYLVEESRQTNLEDKIIVDFNFGKLFDLKLKFKDDKDLEVKKNCEKEPIKI